jgi:hypothetical protein
MENKETKLVVFGTALMLLGIISLIVSSGGHVFAQGPAYDMPGATTQLDMAEQVLTGGANMTVAANMTSAANMTNSTS